MEMGKDLEGHYENMISVHCSYLMSTLSLHQLINLVEFKISISIILGV